MTELRFAAAVEKGVPVQLLGVPQSIASGPAFAIPRGLEGMDDQRAVDCD